MKLINCRKIDLYRSKWDFIQSYQIDQHTMQIPEVGRRRRVREWLISAFGLMRRRLGAHTFLQSPRELLIFFEMTITWSKLQNESQSVDRVFLLQFRVLKHVTDNKIRVDEHNTNQKPFLFFVLLLLKIEQWHDRYLRIRFRIVHPASVVSKTKKS